MLVNTMPSRAHGFTVVELMIVVVIVGVLATLAGPSFSNLVATSRVKTAATDIHMSLVRARSEAIKRNTNITVDAPGGWASGWTISSGVETHGPIPGDTLTITGDTTITYTPNGRTTANPIRIDLSSTETDTKRCVSITLSGQPTVKQEACP